MVRPMPALPPVNWPGRPVRSARHAMWAPPRCSSRRGASLWLCEAKHVPGNPAIPPPDPPPISRGSLPELSYDTCLLNGAPLVKNADVFSGVPFHRARPPELAPLPGSEAEWLPAELRVGPGERLGGVNVDPAGQSDKPLNGDVSLQEAGVGDPGHAEGGTGVHPAEDRRF